MSIDGGMNGDGCHVSNSITTELLSSTQIRLRVNTPLLIQFGSNGGRWSYKLSDTAVRHCCINYLNNAWRLESSELVPNEKDRMIFVGDYSFLTGNITYTSLYMFRENLIWQLRGYAERCMAADRADLCTKEAITIPPP